jgi:hypothetical protein
MRGSFIIVSALALAGCGTQPVVESVKADAPFSLNATSPEAALPEPVTRLPGTEYELEKPLTELARIKYVGLPMDRRPDGFTGGEAVHGRYENGMLDFFTMPDGGLWKIRLTSGIADQCGTKLDTPDEISHFIKTVTPSTNPADIAPKLAAAIRENRVEQVFVGSLRYTAAGDCRHSIDVTEMNALPPDKRG